MDEVFDRISSVLQGCLQASNTEDVTRLDVISFNLRSRSVELGELLHEIMISSRPLPIISYLNCWT